MRNEGRVREAVCCCLMDWVGVGQGSAEQWTQNNLRYGSFEAALKKVNSPEKNVEYKIINKKMSLLFGEEPSQQVSRADKGKGEKENRLETNRKKHKGMSERKKNV